ncbi:MAG TPA: tetratricopeptide repeat protein, partial [Roseiflexaceae bacterium]
MHKRLGHDGDLAEVEGISRGIPLLVAALCDQIQAEGHVGPYRGPPAQDQALHAIERTIVQRWWRSAAQRSGTIPGQSSLRDRQRIRALALLLRPDEELVCELWGTMRDECRTAMDIIADRYSCMFAGCSRYDMSDVVRDLVREETLTRTRHSLEWQPIEVGLTRGLALAQRRAAQELSKLKAIDECYASSRWCEAVLDQLNFLLWLGQSDAAQRLLLKHWIAARFAGAAFDDWLLAHAAVLAPKTPDWLRLVHALQIQDYHALDRFSSLLDSRDRAILCYMQSRRSQVDVVTNTMAEQCDKYIELLRQGHSADPAWAPVQDALFDALSSRGHYLLYEQRDYYAAQKDFDEMLKLRPGDLVALRRRGTARQALGDPHGAHDDFSQVLTKNGADAAARYGRGELRRTLRDLPGALDDFNAALDLYPDDPVVRNARGRVSYAHGKLPEALADFDAALGRRQDDPDMWIDRARVRKALGNTKEALDDLTAAINLRNDDPIAFGLRGAYRPANDPVALLDLDKSLDLLPDQPDMHYHRGQVHMARGDTARAMDDLNRSIELRDDPDARYA